MTELDQVWSQMLDDARERSADAGRNQVAEYLSLRATNDAIRRAGVGWLFDTIIEIAGDASREQTRITIERKDPHSFARGTSNMVGSLVSVRLGVRCLTVEAGWARTPSDGIMRGHALALAQITHFGMPRHGAELRLVHAGSLPHWVNEASSIVDSGELRRHFELFLGM